MGVDFGSSPIKRRFDPINRVWMRIVPNIGLSVAEYERELDEIAVDAIMRSPAAQELLAQLTIDRVKAAIRDGALTRS